MFPAIPTHSYRTIMITQVENLIEMSDLLLAREGLTVKTDVFIEEDKFARRTVFSGHSWPSVIVLYWAECNTGQYTSVMHLLYNKLLLLRQKKQNLKTFCSAQPKGERWTLKLVYAPTTTFRTLPDQTWELCLWVPQAQILSTGGFLKIAWFKPKEITDIVKSDQHGTWIFHTY